MHKQEPFFGEGHPDTVNFGSIGWIFAHELFHAFDHVEDACQPQAMDWWTPKTKAEFSSRGQCLLEQYGDHERAVQMAKSAFSENVADHAAAKLAYQAYSKFIKSHCSNQEVRTPKK